MEQQQHRYPHSRLPLALHLSHVATASVKLSHLLSPHSCPQSPKRLPKAKVASRGCQTHKLPQAGAKTRNWPQGGCQNQIWFQEAATFPKCKMGLPPNMHCSTLKFIDFSSPSKVTTCHKNFSKKHRKSLKFLGMFTTPQNGAGFSLAPTCVGSMICDPFVSDPGSVHVHLCRMWALRDVVCVGRVFLPHHVVAHNC